MVERSNGRIEAVLQGHHARPGENPEATPRRYVWLTNQQFTQSALGSRSPLQAMQDWHKVVPQLFGKQACDVPGWDALRASALACDAVTLE
jgi:hypothetical protein